VASERDRLSALLITLACGCSTPDTLKEFESFERVKAAALAHGCIERFGEDHTSLDSHEPEDYFECDRIVGTSCDCKVTLQVERYTDKAPGGTRQARRAGIRALSIKAICPRASGAAIANDLLAAAIPERHRTEARKLISDPSVAIEPGTRVERYKRFGSVDLTAAWTPVLASWEPKPVALATPDVAETLEIRAEPRYANRNERPLKIVAWSATSKDHRCR